MTQTHWWTLSTVLSLALTCAAAPAQQTGTCTGCPKSPCGGCSSCPTGCPAASTCGDGEESGKCEEVEAAPAKAKCACEKCECKDGKCSCEKGKCSCAKSDKCDCGKCKCGCAKCDCSKAAAAKCGGAIGSCVKGCCGKCAKKASQVKSDSNEAEKSGESEYVSIVLEDLTINYFGAGVNIKKIKVRYKGQGIEAGDIAKDISSIGRGHAPACGPIPCYAVPAPAAAPVRIAH